MRNLVNKITYRVWRTVREYFYRYFPATTYIKDLTQNLPNLTIETTNICNANCIFCGYQYQKRQKKAMTNDLFIKSILDFVNMGGGSLGIMPTVGDPLLDRLLIERIKYARSYSQINKIQMITNCINLHNVGVLQLLSSGVSTISISTTGFNEEMYKRIYRSLNYKIMKKNIIDLLRANHQLGKPVRIAVGLRIDKSFQEVINYPDFQEVKELADEITPNYFYDSWDGRIQKKNLSGNMKIRPNIMNFFRRNTPCAMLYGALGVLVDGTVTACPCRDLNGNSDLVLGNVKERNLQEMYLSPKLQQIREDWLSGLTIPDICRNCLHYSPYTYLMLSEVRGKLTH
jgi:MoaA/NifB/PqqE/SkfB family radical SAM enzyme